VFKSSKIRREQLWSAEDTNAFFEGLNEFGKDYESIQWFMANKSKRKGACDQTIKSKEQLRHFYYRTWHKICKYIEFPKGNLGNLNLLGLIVFSYLLFRLPNYLGSPAPLT